MGGVAVASWADLVSKGTDNAMTGLSQMVGTDITVTAFALRRVPVAEIAMIFGGAETMAVGIYLEVSGHANGHLMLMYDPKIATAFVDLVMMQEPGTTQELGEMETSALGEMGNIIGAFFLNALADETGLDLRPSPPSVMTDMAGALLDIVTADILMTSDYTYLAESTFEVEGREISGVFFVIPSEELLAALVNAEARTA